MSGGVIGFDLDGSLAYYIGPHGNTAIGDPIIKSPDGRPTPYQIALKLHSMGIRTRCFTARAMWPGEVPKIRKWLDEHGLPNMTIDHQKHADMVVFFDDRAVALEENTGRILGGNIPDFIIDVIEELTEKEQNAPSSN